MVKHNGRLSMKQFMPMKPVKRGIKVWECAEVSSGFVCDFQVCTGKRQDGVTEKNLGYLVVHNLTLPAKITIYFATISSQVSAFPKIC